MRTNSEPIVFVHKEDAPLNWHKSSSVVLSDNELQEFKDRMEFIKLTAKFGPDLVATTLMNLQQTQANIQKKNQQEKNLVNKFLNTMYAPSTKKLLKDGGNEKFKETI